jgi:hypothetical protein
MEEEPGQLIVFKTKELAIVNSYTNKLLLGGRSMGNPSRSQVFFATSYYTLA